MFFSVLMTAAFLFLFSIVRFLSSVNLLFPTLKSISPCPEICSRIMMFFQTCISFFCSTVWKKSLKAITEDGHRAANFIAPVSGFWRCCCQSVLLCKYQFPYQLMWNEFSSGKCKDCTSSLPEAVYRCSLQKWLSWYLLLPLLSHSLLGKDAVFQITLHHFHQQFWLNWLTLLWE